MMCHRLGQNCQSQLVFRQIKAAAFFHASVAVCTAATLLYLLGFSASAFANPTGKNVSSQDEGKPLWELGSIGFSAYLPHSPGSNQSQGVLLPLPFFTYRGEHIRSDKEGLLRGIFIDTEEVKLDISLNGSFPVFADDNTAREGMEELDWLGEIGPNLKINLLKTKANDRSARIDFELPVRAAFSASFDNPSPTGRGFVSSPSIVYSNKNFRHSGINFRIGLSAVFASEKFMDYFYEVGAADVRLDRARYDAKAGYLGSHFKLSLDKQFAPRWNWFFSSRADIYQGGTNLDSPLHKSDTNWGVLAGIRYAIFQSDTRVKH